MLNREEKVGIAVIVVLAVGSFAAGRYSVPEKIKTETKIVEIEKKTDTSATDDKKNRHKKTTTTTITLPDGTKKTTTTTTDDVSTDKSTKTSETDTVSKTTDEKKDVVRVGSLVTVSALVGAPLSLSGLIPIYGLSVTKPILGPITVGAWGLTNKTAGLSLGLTF